MDAERKRLGRTTKRLGRALEAGDLSAFRHTLDVDPDHLLLTAIQEQKILLRMRPEDEGRVIEILTDVSSRALDAAGVASYRAYLEFVPLYRQAHGRLQSKLEGLVRLFPKTGLAQMADVVEQVVHNHLRTLSWPAPGSSVADYERRLHDLNGYANDVAYAALRVLNETARFAIDERRPDQRRTKRVAVERRMLKATMIAAELNALEWVFDSVSYGDLVVASLDCAGRRVRLDHADARRTLLRILAIRRDIVLDFHGARAPRFVRDRLAGQAMPAFDAALAFYCELVGLDGSAVDRTKVRRGGEAILTFVGAEDDLLVAACRTKEASTYYVVAALMQWFELVRRLVLDALPAGRRRRVSSVPIPLYRIVDAVRGEAGSIADEAVRRLSCTLPARSHYDLVRRPFVRLDDDFAACVLNSGPWTTSVREALLGGGSLGDAYGRIWEDFYERSFEESDWQILGRNLVLRRHGKPVTDVDLLVKRDDLVLVVQIKALIGAGVSPYDHWRNRQTVEWGCRQAAAAADFIRQDAGWLASVAGRARAGEVRHVQPVVLTTLDHVDGWSFEGVPIIAEVGRKAITEGSKVTYTDPRTGEIVSTRHFTRQEELSTERILWALENPVALLLSPERLRTAYRVAVAGELGFELPEYEIELREEGLPPFEGVAR